MDDHEVVKESAHTVRTLVAARCFFFSPDCFIAHQQQLVEALRFSGAVERCSFHSSICLYEIAVCGQLHSRRCAPFATVPCLHNLASTDSRLVFPVQDVEWFPNV